MRQTLENKGKVVVFLLPFQSAPVFYNTTYNLHQKEPSLSPLRAHISLKSSYSPYNHTFLGSKPKCIQPCTIPIEQDCDIFSSLYLSKWSRGDLVFPSQHYTQISQADKPTIMYTKITKSPAGAELIQGDLHAFPMKGEYLYWPCRCVDGLSLGLIHHWNVDIIKCIFSLFSSRYYERRPYCIPVTITLFILYDIVFNCKMKDFYHFCFRTSFHELLFVHSHYIMTQKENNHFPSHLVSVFFISTHNYFWLSNYPWPIHFLPSTENMQYCPNFP